MLDNTHVTQNLTESEESREETKKYHRTRCIVYGACWMVSGLIIFFATALGALIGSMFGAKGAAIMGSIFFFGSLIACIAFLILAIYHLIKWLNV